MRLSYVGGLRSGIRRKAYRNKPLTSAVKRCNKLVGQERYKIEQVFGSIKRWFGANGSAM